MTNFYASPEYLSVVAQVYFKGRSTSVEDVLVGDDVLRLLVVDGKRAITRLEFLDYHEPLPKKEDGAAVRRRCYASSVVRRVIEASEWDPNLFQGFEPAPFIDWSRFPTYEAYQEFLKSRRKGLYKEQQRRRRRLAENFGELEFRMNDDSPDVFELARQWKIQQFHDTGARNYLAEPRNLEYLETLRRNGLLTTSTLRAGGRLLSVWMGFVHQNVWSGWIFTYDHDPELRKYSVGQQLLHSMVEESHRRGHREFDFSVGDEGYKWFYATNARVLGPIGRPPWHEHVKAGTKRAKRYAKRALASHPKLLEGAVSLGGALRRERNLVFERLRRLGYVMRFDKANG